MKRILGKSMRKGVMTGVLIGTMLFSAVVCKADTYNHEDYPWRASRPDYPYGSVTYTAKCGVDTDRYGAMFYVNTSERLIIDFSIYAYNYNAMRYEVDYASGYGIGSATKTVDPYGKRIHRLTTRFCISNINTCVWKRELQTQ